MLKGGCFVGSTAPEKHLHVQFKNVNFSYPLSYPSCRINFSCVGLQETRYSSNANDIFRAE